MNSADFAGNRGEGDWSEEVSFLHSLCVCCQATRVYSDCEIQMCTSGMFVTYFRSAPVGAQVCFSLQTPFDQPFWPKSNKQRALQLKMWEPCTPTRCQRRKQFFLGGC